MSKSKKKQHCYDWPMPAATADAVVWTFGPGGWRILLIERKSDPFAGSWSLPGGFINPEEPPFQACIRELKEETNVSERDFREVGVFGDPGRDPRGWTISFAYYTFQPEGELKARAGDDATRTRWHSMERLPKLAFDHDKIIAKAKDTLAVDLVTTDIARGFFESTFTRLMVNALLNGLARTDNALERLRVFGVVEAAGRGRWKFR
jgi:8-oxo-dGTP diphosphatase